MKIRILPVWRTTGLACLLVLTTNCVAEPDGKAASETGGKTDQAVVKTYDLQTREQAADLYNAIVANDIEKIKAALEKGLSPEERYLRSMSAMELAADTGRPEAMDLLIRYGGNPNHKNKKNIPLLAIVLDHHYRWDKKRIEKLKKDNNPAMPPDSKGVADVLLRHGADPNSVYPIDNDSAQPVLSYAAEHNDLEMVRRLIELGADVNAPKNSTQAPLFWAAEKGHEEIAKYLVEQGADIYAKDSRFNTTPIESSVNKNTVDVAFFFLEKGVDPNEFSTFYLAFTEKLPRESRHKFVKALLDKGMDVSQHEISSVIWDRDLITLKMLIEAGTPLCKRDYYNKTLYDIAHKRGYQEIADYLASRGGANCP